MRTNIQLPSFHGFYESIWSSLADDFIDYDSKERGITKVDDWRCKWDEFQMEVVKQYTDMYIDLVNSELELNIRKMAEPELDSPRYYNYRTDRIYVDIHFQAIRKVRALMRKHESEMRKLIHDHHTSRDGFISFMSNDFDEWISEYLVYGGEDFGLYLSFAIYYLLGLEHGWDIDVEFYDWICGNVVAEWYPDSEAAKDEYEKVLLVEDAYGFGSYKDEEWGNMSVEECRLKIEGKQFDAKYQLSFNF